MVARNYRIIYGGRSDMCEFCEKKFYERNFEFEVKELSERKASRYNPGYCTGMQMYVDIDDSTLNILALITNI